MAGFKMLNDSQRRELLDAIGQQIVQWHKDRILNQKNVDGSPYAPLTQNTKDGKSGKCYFFTNANGKTVRVDKPSNRKSKNPDKRMMDTGDFRNHAFLYKITNSNELSVYISQLPHRFDVTFDAQERVANTIARQKFLRKNTNISKGRIKKAVGNGKTYEQIAYFNLNNLSPFHRTGKTGISPRNKGCSFMGLNDVEMQKLEKLIEKTISQYLMKNLDEQMQKIATGH